MPVPLKALLSAVVACGGAAMAYLEHRAGAGHVGWAVAALAALMVFGVWLFPDTRKGARRGGAR